MLAAGLVKNREVHVAMKMFGEMLERDLSRSVLN